MKRKDEISSHFKINESFLFSYVRKDTLVKLRR